MVVLVTCKNKEEPIKNEEARVVTNFLIITQLELSVAMETMVNLAQNLMHAIPHPMILQMKFDYDWPAGLRDIQV